MKLGKEIEHEPLIVHNFDAINSLYRKICGYVRWVAAVHTKENDWGEKIYSSIYTLKKSALSILFKIPEHLFINKGNYHFKSRFVGMC